MSNLPNVADQLNSSFGKRLGNNIPSFIMIAVIGITVARYIAGPYSDLVLVPPLVLSFLLVVYSATITYRLPFTFFLIAGCLMWCALLVYELKIEESRNEGEPLVRLGMEAPPFILDEELDKLSEELSQAINSVASSKVEKKWESIKTESKETLTVVKRYVDERIGPLFDNVKLESTLP